MSKSRDIADSAATINYIDNVTSDVQSQLNTLTTAVDNISVTSGTLTKTFTTGESSTINLTSSVLAPVVSVTKEVAQTGTTNNSWDVNSTTENYTRLDSATATTLDFSFSDNVDSTFTSANSVTVSSQDSNAKGAVLSSDGTKMFVCGDSNDVILEYALSTAYDLSTATYTQQFDVSSQTADPKSIFFKPDGTEFYLGGDDKVVQYSLSTAWDISTASHTATKTISGYGNTHFIAFNTDGTSLFFVGLTSTTYIWKFNLSTAWSISTASYNSGANISSTVANATARGLAINSDGTKFYVATTSNNIKQFSTSTAYNVSTLSFDNKTSQTLNSGVFGIFFPSDFSRLYVTTSTVVYEYTNAITGLTLGSGSFASADVGKTIEANSGVFILTSTAGAISQTTAPTSYAQVASGSWEMYGVVYNAADGDLELSSYVNGYDLSAASYDSVSFYFGGSYTDGVDLAFNTDGSKFYMLNDQYNIVIEYTLSVNFDISTAVYSQQFAVGGQASQPTGLAFSLDGTKMFMCARSGTPSVFEYSLSTAFDVSTASYSQSFAVNGQEISPQALAFNTTGTKMFVVGSDGDDVNEYELSTGFDVSTASFVDSFSVASQEATPTGISFNSDGTKMFIVGFATDSVYQYDLATAFDVSTASYSSVSFSVSSEETEPNGIAFSANGTKMYVVGRVTDRVYQYSTISSSIPSGYHAAHTTTSIDSTYWTDINSMTADEAAGDGAIYYCVSTDDRTTWKIAKGTDGERSIVRNNSGTWQYNSNGTYASTTWANATTNTELNALQEAMTGASASVPYDLANSTEVTFTSAPSVGGTEVFILSADGTRGYWLSSSDIVYQADLPSAFTGSGGSWGGLTSFSVTSQETTPTGLRFKSDGTKMYIVGYATDAVYQYSLSTAWDVTSASYDSVSFSVSSQMSTPGHLSFSENGSYMYISDINTKVVYQYNLSTAWDLSSASYSSNSITLSSPSGLTSVDVVDGGTKMFASFTGQIKEYSLSSAYDVSTATATSDSISSLGFNSPSIQILDSGGYMALANGGDGYLRDINVTTSYPNQMNKTQLDAVSDANHFTLGNDLDLAIIFNLSSGSTVPSSDGVAINYDANVLNQGAILGTDYTYDAPAQNKVRITALTGNNLKVRVV